MLLLISHILIISACLIMKIVGLDEQAIGIFFIISSFFMTIMYIISLKNIENHIKLILLIGFIVRTVLVVIDTCITRLPEAGFDDDSFYRTSLALYNDGYSNMSSSVYGESFSKFLAIVYYFIGSSRVAIQYFNVLLFVIGAVLFIKALKSFNISSRSFVICVALICLLPNAVLTNSLLRRETAMELCVCSSVFYISKWYKERKVSYILGAILSMVFASLFHTVFIFGALLLVLYFMFYDKNKGAVSFSINNFGKAIVVMAIAIMACASFLSMFNNKFSSVDNMDDIYTATNRVKGGSAYLEGYEVHSLGELIIFTPLKLFYFLFSPAPWKFRNLMDIVSFLLDALIYVVLLFYVFRRHRGTISRLMLNIFLVLSVVFALGTFNSGTAIRHRFSLLPFLLVSYAMVENSENKRIGSDKMVKHQKHKKCSSKIQKKENIVA